jgi:hypothetical protein
MGEVRSEPASTDPWPVLTLSKWEDTRDTLHLWSQVVGKVRLALEPMINHWWQVPLYVSARGLTTSLMHVEGRGLELELDFIDHVLLIRTSRGEVREVRLQPQSVADFYAATIAALDDLGISLQLMARPVEVPVRGRHRAACVRSRCGTAVLVGPAAEPTRDARVPRAIHRQGEPGALLLGLFRPCRQPVLRPARAKASRWCAELRGFRAGAGLQPRAQQRRLLARRE